MLSNDAKKYIKRTLDAALEKKELAGANLIVLKDGKELFYYEDGYSSIEDSTPIGRSSLFRLYSMSKPVTAAAVMILMERGYFDLFDGIGQYLPGFCNQMVDINGSLEPVKRDISIKDLLDMTSGLLYGGENLAGRETEALFKEMDARLQGENPMSTVEFANRLAKVPLAFHPGDSWAYGTSADVLGALVEVVSGKSFGSFLKDEIFTPLGMNDTGFSIPPEHRNRLASTYAVTDKNTLELYQGNHLGILNAMDREPAFESGGAGLVSTIDDYARFAQMLLNGGTLGKAKILNPKTVQFMTSSLLSEAAMKSFRNWHTLEGHSYGNLMRIVTEPGQAGLITSMGEYGWDGWLGCHFANFPKEQISILMMLQKKDAGTTPVTRKIRNIVLTDLMN